MSEVIPVLLGPSIPKLGQNTRQDAFYHRAMPILFKPWQKPSDLKQPGETWTEAFHAYQDSFSEEHRQIISNVQVLHECKDARDRDHQETNMSLELLELEEPT